MSAQYKSGNQEVYVCLWNSQVNHLSHFYLTLELLPNITETASSSGDGRILFVSSTIHYRSTPNFDTINSEEDYGRFKAYGCSKLYNVRLLYSG